MYVALRCLKYQERPQLGMILQTRDDKVTVSSGTMGLGMENGRRDNMLRALLTTHNILYAI